MKCHVCNTREAVVYQRHTGRALCLDCFEKDLLARVKHALTIYGVEPSDRILIAVSGGKDSIALMYLLSRIHPIDRLTAVTVVEGVSGYERSYEVRLCSRIASELGISYEVIKV